MSSNSISPNHREILSARSTITGKQEYLTSTSGVLNVSSGGEGGGNVNLTQVGGASIALGQTTMSASLPVTIASNQASIPVAATLSAETTKVIGTVNQGTSPWVTSNATTSIVGNGAAATAQRVTLANDSTGVIATVGAVTAITNALPAGTNGIGKLTANTGVTIGAVEIAAAQTLATVTNVATIGTSVTPGTAAANLGKAEDAAHASGDTGVAAWGVRNDNLATTYGADQDYGPLATDKNGRIMVSQKAATGTLSNVGGSATSVTVLAANSARIGATVTNDSSALLYLKFGATASTTSYTVVLAGAASAPFSYYEVPAGYTGIIDGIWASATGNARVTEIT